MRRFWLIALSLTVVLIPGRAQQPAQSTGSGQPASEAATKKVNTPTVLNKVDPVFSAEARRKHLNGHCLISLTVDTDGMPQNIKLIRCSDPSFEKTSMDAAAKFRFSQATTQDGKPVSANVFIEIKYRLARETNPWALIHYEINSAPGAVSSEPGADGVYSLTKMATAPTMNTFADRGYGAAAFASDGHNACDVVLTISANGNPSHPQETHCDIPAVEKPALRSLLSSHYLPGKVNGKAVPMRVSVHLEYGGHSPKP
jgi:hypothetical protein